MTYVIKKPNGSNYLTVMNEGVLGEGADVPIRTESKTIGRLSIVDDPFLVSLPIQP